MKVAFNNLKAQWDAVQYTCSRQFDTLFEESDFILGKAVDEFEKLFADYVGCKYAVGVSNGMDALKLAAQSLDLKGTVAVLLPANTFVATILGIEQALPDADYKLIDCDTYHQIDIEKVRDFVAVNRKTYDHIVVVPVHLYGYTCDMKLLAFMCEHYDCIILEDASQAHGAKWKDVPVGSYGKVAAFSLYPGKNLGAAGDAGIVTTNDKEVYDRLQLLRNVGSVEKYKHEVKGSNNRLDTLQAIILKEKMKYLERWNHNRRQIVKQYETKIVNKRITLPETPIGCLPVHHIYPVLVEDRVAFQRHLDLYNIQHGIHYPILIEEMSMYRDLSVPNEIALDYSKKIVSLPIHPFMCQEEIDYLCIVLNSYGVESDIEKEPLNIPIPELDEYFQI